MPHFVIDCSKDILEIQDPKAVILQVHNDSNNSGLFEENDIKVRLNPFTENYLVGGKESSFIHVFANIMEGRTTEQKANLSKQIVAGLKTLFPDIPFIDLYVDEWD